MADNTNPAEKLEAAIACADLLIRIVRPMYSGPSGDQGLNDPLYGECLQAITRYTQSRVASPTEARTALDLGDMGPFDLVDALKQEYHTRQKQAEQAREDGKSGAVRTHTGVMAALADLLSRYYQGTGDCVLAETWTDRAFRYHRRAYLKRNTVAENIGARMP